ncbi:ribosome small subunit-dependent GTPase A [Lentibacillus saliphilus]|uniref:ribosome small subunit-dependent GTPase A n=1 Tax=Lentibacillus saliphilus TaxID=2737028 RepID=UPI001C30805B|nr:ribosome small subunit-dependent GTPase A [Lentibacillus saliphilus]
MLEGRILKALSGFYYVKNGTILYQCRGRGVFRNQAIKPLVGDLVQFEPRENNEGYITHIQERQNELVRPPVANIDQAIIMSSAVDPSFSPLLLDRFLLLMEAKRIDAIIVISKMDLSHSNIDLDIKAYREAYEQIGYPVIPLSIQDQTDIQKLGHYLTNKVSVIAGQSGVGKSTLINELNQTLNLETGDISKSLGRGKHTTRHVELLDVYDGLIADTPGFSSIDFSEIDLDELSDCFPEMRHLNHQCKFRGCTHRQEPGCAVKVAVDEGTVPAFRYKHYLNFYDEIQSRKPRY